MNKLINCLFEVFCMFPLAETLVFCFYHPPIVEEDPPTKVGSRCGPRYHSCSWMARVHRIFVNFGQVYLYLVPAAWLHRLPNSCYNVWAHSNERVQICATTGNPSLFEEAGHRCDVFGRLWGWWKANENHGGGDLGPNSLGSKRYSILRQSWS